MSNLETIKGDSDLYERYMDDILCTVRKSEIDERLTMINELHDNLRFTYEIENEGTILLWITIIVLV